ncbi:MAG: TIGR01440 family protein [Clostridia bacterium]|nr:TIGR01440 family protein [Clostridia bacterium]
MTEQEMIHAQVTKAILDVAKAGKLQPGAQIVIGRSTSEIAGGQIGKASVPEIGEWVAKAVLDVCREQRFIPIFQCCEHLNRSLVMPLFAAKESRYVRVNAIPQPKAGGSVPAVAWKLMDEPCLVMNVQADAGLDIGDTLIGMHLRPVAVPYRGEVRKIGQANLVCAYSRLPYVGGERAVYRAL